MAGNDTQRRQLLSANLKSAITTAAIVGAIGGWAAFGTQQTTVATTSTGTTQVVAQAVDSATTDQSSASTASSAASIPAVAVTRSSR